MRYQTEYELIKTLNRIAAALASISSSLANIDQRQRYLQSKQEKILNK